MMNVKHCRMRPSFNPLVCYRKRSLVYIVLLVLLFLTGPLAYMPDAVLSAVVFLIGLALIDIKGLRKIYAEARSEFWVALITVAVVVFVGVEQGIILAMALSLLDHVRRGYRPKNTVVVKPEGGGWRTLPVASPGQFVPGLLVYRFTHSMYYANAQSFSEDVLELVKGAEPPLSWFCIDADAIDDVDFSAAETLRTTYGVLKEQGIRLVFVNELSVLINFLPQNAQKLQLRY
jgi:MFS superfamily sulfate permease-like transporter